VGTEDFKHGVVSLLLAFALVFSMISVTSFASSGNLISHPGGTTIEVVQGSTFILSQRLVWDEPENGDYIVTIYWEAIENKPSENFTFVEVSAYFVTGPYENESIEASFTFKETVSPYTGNLLYTLGVRTTVSDNRDGEFNVDITLRASGAGGVPHAAGDHLIEYSAIVVSEARMRSFYPDPVTVHVLQSPVLVSIWPSENSAGPGENVTFTVTVTNTGENDTYEMKATDNAGWEPTLSENSLTLAPGESSVIYLGVTIPDDAPIGAEDIITVMALGVRASNLAKCMAYVGMIKVIISPDYLAGLPGVTLNYTVTVTNTSENVDNYDLTISDNENWGPTLSENLLANIGPGENETTTLTVKIPENALPGIEDNITVTATSRADNTVSDNASCIATVTVGGVEVSILPENKPGPPGVTIPYDVKVKNTGEKGDNYILTARDNAGWGLMFSETSTGQRENSITLTIAPGGSSDIYLWVAIPGDAQDGTEDNVTVTATSEVYPAVTDSASCMTRVVIIIGVDVYLLPPKSKSGAPGETLTYTVMVTNTGNVEDTYDLWASDNADPSWNPTVSPTSLELGAGKDGEAALTVTIPSYAAGGDSTRITVTATSMEDSTVSDNDSCIASASAVVVRGVGVYISPPRRRSGPPGRKLDYTVTVKNEGNVEDTYDLWASDNADPSWNPTVSPTSLTLTAGASGETTLTVTIPHNASLGAEDNITVIATSKENIDASDNASCVAQATALRMVEVSLSPENQSGPPGETLTYTVTIKNTGNVEDNYALAKSDNAGWVDNITLSENLLEVPPGENKTTTLTVKIPDNAENCTRDNVTVTATSRVDNTIKNSASCTAHAVAAPPPPPPERGVQVLISPENQRGKLGETLTFTVTVKNTGEAEDNYDLTVGDNADWGPTLAENLLTIPTGENRTTTVSVTIPSDAIENESTGITVVATSRGDPTKSDSATCTAQTKALREVEVFVSPESRIGTLREALTYTVLVKNTGSIADTYTLSAVGEAGWSVNIEPTSLTLDAGASGTATLSVVVPPDAVEGTSTINVSATSVGDSAVTGSDTCRTIVTGVPGPGVELPVPLAISAFLIGAAILVPTYLLRRRPKKAARRRVLRDVSFGFR